MTHRAHNFFAGPAALPLPVLQQAQADLVDFAGTGMSIMEMSHRGAVYEEVHARAIANLKTLLGIPEGYRVLFMQGGARGQFAMLAMNLLGDRVGEYVDTGTWSTGAIREARRHGEASCLWTGKEASYRRVPAAGEVTASEDAAYFHYTSNNTIYGTQFHHVPHSGDVPLICDMSSDILSRPVDVSRFGMIYAGAQKNMGPAGVTVVILREDLLERSTDAVPETMNYKLVAAKNSMLNTPPTFAIYMVGLVVAHLLEQGGLDAVGAVNDRKAERLYRAIDESGGFFTGHAEPTSRSIMNVSFRSPSAELDARFVAESAAQGLHGLKGHRSVGGLRASIYNAVREESVGVLLEFMAAFRATHG
jgi:phosphoserine aminotransferase